MRKLVVLFVVAGSLASATPALAWTWPVDGSVVRGFVFGSDPYAAGQHRGVDIDAKVGSVVRAPIGGLVTFRGFVPSGGLTLTLATQDGYSVTLQQLMAIEVAKGAAVLEGAVIGVVASSSDATTTEPHVHLGVRVATDPHGYVDPVLLLEDATRADVPVAIADHAPPSRDERPGHGGSRARIAAPGYTRLTGESLAGVRVV
jgi:murein DD-endopeptidase MepM/ murein hydrolase activator NlpD